MKGHRINNSFLVNFDWGNSEFPLKFNKCCVPGAAGHSVHKMTAHGAVSGARHGTRKIDGSNCTVGFLKFLVYSKIKTGDRLSDDE